MHGGPDHYAVLGLTPSADDVVVRAAWKALLRKHHPDSNPDDPSGIRAREINEAFAVLGKPEARASYDRMRARGPDIVPPRNPPPEGPRYRPIPRRRFSGTRLFGAALLILALAPITIAVLLAYPATAPATHRALVRYSTGSPLAEGLVARLDALAPGFANDPTARAAGTEADKAGENGDTGNGKVATN